MSWFSNNDDKDKVSSAIVFSLESEVDRIKLEKQKNLDLIKEKLKSSLIYNGDLFVEVTDNKKTSFNVFYKKKLLGDLDIDDPKDRVDQLVKSAQKFCPELFIVKTGEFYEIEKASGNTVLAEVHEIYMNSNTGEMVYMFRSLYDSQLFLVYHSRIVDRAIKFQRIS